MIEKKHAKKFLEALFSGKITESEKILENLAKRHNSEEDRRYLLALKGIFYSYVNDDYDALIFKLFKEDNLKKFRKETLEHMERLANRPVVGHDPYFRAWIDVINLLDELPTPHKLKTVTTAEQ